MPMHTNKDLTISWRPSSMSPNFPAHETFVPKGTRVCLLGDCHFVADLSTLELPGFTRHDAEHYGIPVQTADVDETP